LQGKNNSQAHFLENLLGRKEKTMAPPINRVLKNKDQAVRQGARRYDKRSIQAYVSIGESPATLNGGLRRSFSTPC